MTEPTTPPTNPAGKVHPILNLEDVTFEDFGKGDRFSARLGPIGPRIGAQKLGYNLTVLQPGKAAFPFHSHRVNEEMFFVVSGQGEVRIGAERLPIRAGDVIACPPGGPETARQIINTSDAELRYLAVSTMEYPEIAEYPDSGKFATILRQREGAGEPLNLAFRFLGRVGETLDYWDGEA